MDFTLICPPQGKSIADDFAEHINQWVERKMHKSVSQIEFHRQLCVGRVSKEQMDILKDIAKIRTVKAEKQDRKNLVNTSSTSFLAKEKERLQRLRETAKNDEYCSDGSSDDGSSVFSGEDDEEIAYKEAKEKPSATIIKPNTGKLSAKKSSCEERLRDTRITNLQRRYSAQVRTEPIVNVNRRLKYERNENIWDEVLLSDR